MSPQFSPFSKEELIPKPEKIELKKQKGELLIGVPKETHLEENRVCLTPDAVAALAANGHRIILESDAGKGANYSDTDYSEAGAKISYSTKEVFGCNIILKIEPPSLHEISLINPQSVVISALQLKTQNKKYFEVLGNISGVQPTEVVIIGAGSVGEFAARSAMGLGAHVKVFDDSISRLRQLQHNLGFPVATSTIQLKSLTKALKRCDVAIGALRGKSRTPVIVNEAMVEQMKAGAVIVDVSIDRGGCFETSEITTHSKPTFIKHGVIHYCVPNIPSRYSRTASVSISNIFTPYLLNIADKGGIENAARYDKSLQKGIYFYHGILTHKAVGDWFNLPYRDINLLIF